MKDPNRDLNPSNSTGLRETSRGLSQEQADIKRGMLAAAALLGMTEQEIRLGCGEMTAQEMRTVKAVLEWRRQAILRKAETV